MSDVIININGGNNQILPNATEAVQNFYGDSCGRQIPATPVAETEEGDGTERLTLYINKEVDVLFEKASRGKAMHGFTPNYVRVELPARMASDEYDNKIVRVRLGGFNHDKSALRGEALV